ncbi:MAG: tetratricopeptide repeat protein, partial [Deltaproteobacteria bacterium]
DFAKAEAAFNEALRRNPNLIVCYFFLAEIALRQNSLDGAIARYKEAIEVNPRLVAPYMILGMIYEQQGKTALAIDHYKKCLQIDPKFAPAANNLAWILAEEGGDLEEALRLARIAYEAMPDQPNINDTFGWIYARKGFHELAIERFLEALEKLPENPTIHYHLGYAYAKLGKKKEAKAALERALRLSGTFKDADAARHLLEELEGK